MEKKDNKINITEDNRQVAIEKGLKYINNCIKGILNKEIPKLQENYL